ncbi:MAG: ferredoxin [Candidatus Margulisbacteria bacterium]|nr:ferredoxin [Candidatus Margulisiibacteriota bacterium]
MVMRKFIEINEEKCNGCGNCIVDCAEGALQLVNGKAKVVKEQFCDGLGACIGNCPVDALKIIEKDVAAFDEEAVEKHLKSKDNPKLKIAKKEDHACGCPSMAFDRSFVEPKEEKKADNPQGQSELQQWPVQLHLINPQAPYLKGANLLVAATCSAFSYGNFHHDFIKDHIVVVACPKLDRTEPYVDKLTQIITEGEITSITVIRMEVPCCGGLSQIVKEAINKSGKKLPYLEEIITVDGKIR